MTDDQPAQRLELPLQVSGTTVPGPDGTPAAALIFDYKGISAHQIVMSVETAEQLAAQIGPVLAEAAAAARRARLGLILPGNGPMNLPPMPNGHRAN